MERVEIRDCIKLIVKIMIVFALVLATIIVLQYLNVEKFNPESFIVIPQLKEELLESSSNVDLREFVRELDLLSRRAWFTTQHQIKVATNLLLLASLAIVGGVVFLNASAPKEIEKDIQQRTQELNGKLLGFLIGALGVVFCGVAIYLGYQSDLSLPPKVVAQEVEKAEVLYCSLDDFSKNWTQFRGSNRDGIVDNVKLFTDWNIDDNHNVKWKSEIPLSGFSSPIKWQNQIFLTGGNATERKIFSYDSDTGELLWEHAAMDVTPKSAKAIPEVTDDTGFAASTPATDGVRVFAIFATGDLVAVDMQGNRLWSKNLGTPDNPYGYASSLVTTPKQLIVQSDNEEHQTIYVFDSASGEIIWQKVREANISWATPNIITLADNRQVLVVVTSSWVEAYELEGGKELWRKEIMAGEVAVTPIFLKNRVIVVNDNAIAASIDVESGELLWESFSFDMPDVATPVAFDDMMILTPSNGVILAVDTESGEKLWEVELEDGFYCSPIKVGEELLVFDMEGVGHIFKVNREGYTPVQINEIGEMVVAVPIAEENRLYVRTKDAIICFAPTNGGE